MIRRISLLIIAASFVFLASCSQPLIDYDLYDNKPITKQRIVYQPVNEDDLRAVIQTFADRHGFRSRVGRVRPDKLKFSIIMWRDDSMIIGRNPYKMDTFRFGIYVAKAKPISLEAAEELTADLQINMKNN